MAKYLATGVILLLLRNLSFCCSVAQSYPTLRDPMDCSTPDFPVLHHLPELAQTHIHWVGDAIQSSRPLSSPSPALNLFQHPGLFQWVGSSHQVTKGASPSASVLPMNIQGWFPLGLTGLIALQSKGLSRVFSNTTVQKHQFFSARPSLWVQLSHLYITTGKIIAWATNWKFWAQVGIIV